MNSKDSSAKLSTVAAWAILIITLLALVPIVASANPSDVASQLTVHSQDLNLSTHGGASGR